MFPKDFFIRNIEADAYRENFFIAALVSIFVIRIFLKLTDYPQLSHGDFHLAHMLFGGFFMLAALILSFSFFGKGVMHVSSVLGGIGFGTFIDELGKFITRQNDYFFQPTIALIYIIFVLLYLISRFIPRYKSITKREYLVNAIEMLKESAVNDFDIEEERRAKRYLRKSDQKDPIVQAMTRLMTQIATTPPPVPGIISKIRVFFRQWYYVIAQSGIILNLVLVFLIMQTLITILQVVTFFMVHPVLPFDLLGKLYSSALASIFGLIGFFMLRFSRVESYRFFRVSVLISLFLTEFFAFMRSQWYEIFGLAANILMLIVIKYAMEREKLKKADKFVEIA